MEEELEDEKLKEQKENSRPWLYKKGQSGNPAGRPKGTFSLKTWVKNKIASMSDEEREEFLEGMDKRDIWKMAEGLPQQDITSGGEAIIPIPILNLCQVEFTKGQQKQEQTSEKPSEVVSPGIKENTESNQLQTKPEENNQNTTPVIPLNIG